MFNFNTMKLYATIKSERDSRPAKKGGDKYIEVVLNVRNKEVARVTLKEDMLTIQRNGQVETIHLAYHPCENCGGVRDVEARICSKCKLCKLKITSLHDAMAECEGCSWHYAGTGERTRDEIENIFNQSHKA